MYQGRSEPPPGAPSTAERTAGAALKLRRGDGAWLPVGDGPVRLMGVLNLTPDSFSDGGRYEDPGLARERAEGLVAEGADVIDLGAESTRPGAADVPAGEEWRRLHDVLGPLGQRGLRAVLSVDTRHLQVAAQAADAGARLLNVPFPAQLLRQGSRAEVRAVLGRFDGVVLMHARGTPATMTTLARYDGPVEDAVLRELLGIADEICEGDEGLRRRLIFDPGLGFAKDAGQSLRLLERTGWLRERLGRPLLVGASRKSFLGRATGLPVEERLVPSVVAAALAAERGADLLRVHDVAATAAAVRLVAATLPSSRPEGEASRRSARLGGEVPA
jgi:dihydropteroate synthase